MSYWVNTEPVTFTDEQKHRLQKAEVPADAVSWLAKHCANVPEEMRLQAQERTAGQSRDELKALATLCDGLRTTLEGMSPYTMGHIHAWYAHHSRPSPSRDLCRTLRFMSLAAKTSAEKLPKRSEEKPSHRWAFMPVVEAAASLGIELKSSGALRAMVEVTRAYLPPAVKVPKDLGKMLNRLIDGFNGQASDGKDRTKREKTATKIKPGTGTAFGDIAQALAPDSADVKPSNRP